MTPRPSSAPVGRKQLDAIWTRVVIDPLADRLVRPLVPLAWVTPNRVTVAAGLLAVASAAAFVSGRLVLAGLLFQLRFLVDCLDGRLARIRHCGTAWGAALDVLVDTAGILLCFAALSSHLVAVGVAGPPLVAVMVGSCGLYCWTLAQRKALPGGEQRDWLAEQTPATASLPHRYVAAMARRGMAPTPYAVEVEAFALTLAPLGTLLAGPKVAVAGLWAAAAFYIAASALNVYRTWRLTRTIEEKEHQ